MPRSALSEQLSISELQRMLESQRRRLSKLRKQRTRLQKELDELDRQIATLDGRAVAGTRAHNAMSLVATIETVLRKAGKPLPVREIMARVLASGYRSNSANFRALLNQTLIKDERFASVGRGVYQLKK